MNSNKLSVSFIRIIHLTACIGFVMIAAKKKKMQYFVQLLSLVFIFMHRTITERLQLSVAVTQNV